MDAYSGPDRLTLRIGLKDLLPGGMDPEFLLQRGGLFIGLHVVQQRSAGQPASVDAEDASTDPRVVALIALIDECIEQVSERSDRRLLRGILGMYDETKGLRLRDRRKRTGQHFRGPTMPVAAGTLRTHFENDALNELSYILVRSEASSRGQEPPDIDFVRSTQ